MYRTLFKLQILDLNYHKNASNAEQPQILALRKLVQSDLFKAQNPKSDSAQLSDDSDPEPLFVNQQLDSSADEVIPEMSDEEDDNMSGNVSEANEE